jgi:hypothetical protein
VLVHANAQWVHEVVTGPLPDRARLPVLERDGQTVRIDSNRDYQLIHDGFLYRGLLPVRGEARRRDRRTLRFRICGLELNISLKARVRSAGGGVTIFAIQELDRHRRLFASLARDMPVLV